MERERDKQKVLREDQDQENQEIEDQAQKKEKNLKKMVTKACFLMHIQMCEFTLMSWSFNSILEHISPNLMNFVKVK
jgi:hypothetical protein